MGGIDSLSHVATVSRVINKSLNKRPGNADSEREVIELLINNRCDTLIIHSKRLSNDELIAFAKEMSGMVLISRFIAEITDRCISLDNHRGSYLATAAK